MTILFPKLPDVYTNLVENYSQGWEISHKFFFDSLIRVNYTPQSAWLGHIPFMFSIIENLRPRRFVELGSHNGASFFAACQIVKKNNLPIECIAVDNWIGDLQAGFFNEDTFQDFSDHLDENYSDFASLLRKDFNDASHFFAEGSIDLLHIDGFHSFEAVKNDFETWLPKMSSNGVVLFHDVNEYQGSFGVWRFWQQIELDYPGKTFFMGHSHGLGVLCLDRQNESNFSKLISHWQDVYYGQFARHFFAVVAELQDANLQVMNQYIKQIQELDGRLEISKLLEIERDSIKANNQILQEQINGLNHDFSSLSLTNQERNAEIQALYKTFSWRVTRPLRVVRRFISKRK